MTDDRKVHVSVTTQNFGNQAWAGLGILFLVSSIVLPFIDLYAAMVLSFVDNAGATRGWLGFGIHETFDFLFFAERALDVTAVLLGLAVVLSGLTLCLGRDLAVLAYAILLAVTFGELQYPGLAFFGLALVAIVLSLVERRFATRPVVPSPNSGNSRHPVLATSLRFLGILAVMISTGYVLGEIR